MNCVLLNGPAYNKENRPCIKMNFNTKNLWWWFVLEFLDSASCVSERLNNSLNSEFIAALIELKILPQIVREMAEEYDDSRFFVPDVEDPLKLSVSLSPCSMILSIVNWS